MAIKSRKKYIPYILWALLIYAGVLAIMVVVDVAKHRSFLIKDAYFQSQAFENQIELHFNLIRYYHMDNKDYPQLTDASKIGADRSAAWKVAYGVTEQRRKDDIRSVYSEKIAEANNQEKSDEVLHLQQEENNKLDEVPNEISKLLDLRKSQYLAYKNKEFADVENSLNARSGSFHYYIKDGKNDSIYRNMNEPTDKDVKQALYVIQLPQAYVKQAAFQGINKYFQQID